MENLTFGEQVKIILSRKGMTIKELAEQIEERTGKRKSLLSSACMCCVWQYLLPYTQSAEILFRGM